MTCKYIRLVYIFIRTLVTDSSRSRCPSLPTTTANITHTHTQTRTHNSYLLIIGRRRQSLSAAASPVHCTRRRSFRDEAGGGCDAPCRCRALPMRRATQNTGDGARTPHGHCHKHGIIDGNWQYYQQRRRTRSRQLLGDYNISLNLYATQTRRCDARLTIIFCVCVAQL